MGCDFMTVSLHYLYGFLKPFMSSICVQARYIQYHQKSDNFYHQLLKKPMCPSTFRSLSSSMQSVLDQKLNSYLSTYVLKVRLDDFV